MLAKKFTVQSEAVLRGESHKNKRDSKGGNVEAAAPHDPHGYICPDHLIYQITKGCLLVIRPLETLLTSFEMLLYWTSNH